MTEAPSITVPLTPAALADLTAMAAASGMGGPELAASLLVEWMKPRAVAIRPDLIGEAAVRFATLRRWIQAGRPGAGYQGYAACTLRRWEVRWQTDGLPGLVNRRHDPRPFKHPRPLSDRAADFLRSVRRRVMRQTRLRRPCFRNAYRAAVAEAERRGWATVSEQTVRRFLFGREILSGRGPAAPADRARERVRAFVKGLEEAA